GTSKPPAKPQLDPQAKGQKAAVDAELESALASAEPLIRQYIKRGVDTPEKEQGYEGALYDSDLILFGERNAELTLNLRIFFMRVHPSIKGAGVCAYSVRDGDGKEFKLEEITDQAFYAFRREACRQACETWNDSHQLCLMTPNDYTGFDYPKDKP